MEPKETDLAKKEEKALQAPVVVSPLMGIIAAASTDGNVDADKLMKLLEANERYEKNVARKAFHVAMAEFKKNPPKIIKDKNVSFGQTNYNHATLANVTSEINEALSEQGLTAAWVNRQGEGNMITVVCRVTHVLGHSEENEMTAPPDDSGKKNKIQQIASTITYLQRYTLLGITGLATYENENDGNPPVDPKSLPKPTAEEQKALDDIYKLTLDSVPDGLTLDKERFTTVIHALWGYPDETTNISTAAATIIANLTSCKSWETVCKKS